MLHSRIAKMLAAILLPPVGLGIVWLASDWRIPRKIVASLGLVIWSVAALVLFFGLRFEFNGGTTGVVYSFYKAEAHYDAVEKSRALQQKDPAPGIPETVITAAPPDLPKLVEPAKEAATTTEPAKLSAYWTSYRGPNRDGIYSQTPTLDKWPAEGLKPIWIQPIGGGYSSFVVANGIAYTIEQRRKQEVVSAYVLATGRELWANRWDAEFTESLGGDGPRATPTWDNGRIYAVGAQGEFRCLDARTGAKIWSKNILTENGATNLPWGVSGAPLIVGDTVVVLPGGPAGKSVAAYNKLTGAPAWSALDDKTAYVSPMLATVAGKRQIIVVTGHRVVGLTPENGALLWEYPWQTNNDINCSQPIVVGEHRVYISSGYGHGAAVFELTAAGDTFGAKTIWSNTKMKNKFASAVLVGDYVYGLDEAILACIDVRTGDLKWKGGRYGYGQIALAAGHVIVLTEAGELVLVKASPDKYEEVSKFTAFSGKTWNVPALSDGYLLVRNTTTMAAYKIAK